jgi:hypothetical protein
MYLMLFCKPAEHAHRAARMAMLTGVRLGLQWSTSFGVKLNWLVFTQELYSRRGKRAIMMARIAVDPEPQ